MTMPASPPMMAPTSPPLLAPGGPSLPGEAPAQLPPPAPALPAQLPPPAPALPAQIGPNAVIAERKVAEDISNPFERTATMIVDTAQDQAEKLAQNLGDHAADTVSTPHDTVAEMFHFSPYGADASMRFWQVHDELLQMAVQNNDPDPYAVAERGALDEVFPYRSKIALLDSLGPEQRVARAEQLLKISHNQMARGNMPEAMPSLTGPAGLPAATGG